MKKIISLLLISILVSVQLLACDICGCGMGGSLIGIVPQFNNNIIGVRYRYQQFNHKDVSYSLSGSKKVLKDVYQSAELWSRYNVSNRLQFFVSVPYVSNNRIDNVSPNPINGIGDISTTLNYIFYNSGDSTNKTNKLMLYGGASIKLPTGKYQIRNADKLMHPLGIQPGTGAWGAALNAGGVIRNKQFGLSVESRYLIQSQNELSYQLGNQWLNELNLFYWRKFGFNSLLLHLGSSYEVFGKDKNFDLPNQLSGGKVWYGSAGVDFFYRQWMLGTKYGHALDINTPSVLPTAGPRIQVQLNHFF
jgi:hypothetical protein